MTEDEDDFGPVPGDDDLDYAVGKGRPPQHRRFGAGPDANPRYRSGRRKGMPNLRSVWGKVLTETIKIRDGSTPRKVTRLEAVLLALRNAVAQGQPRALQIMGDITASYHPDPDVHLRAVLILPERINDPEEWLAHYAPTAVKQVNMEVTRDPDGDEPQKPEDSGPQS